MRQNRKLHIRVEPVVSECRRLLVDALLKRSERSSVFQAFFRVLSTCIRCLSQRGVFPGSKCGRCLLRDFPIVRSFKRSCLRDFFESISTSFFLFKKIANTIENYFLLYKNFEALAAGDRIFASSLDKLFYLYPQPRFLFALFRTEEFFEFLRY